MMILRKLNTIVARIIILLLILHAILGSLMMAGVITFTSKGLSHTLEAFVWLHALISIILSIPSVRAGIKSGKWYFRENAAFWSMRITGIAMAILIILHFRMFTVRVNGYLFLEEFGFFKVIMMLLLMMCIVIHGTLGIRSSLIKKGKAEYREKTELYSLSISTVMLFCAVCTTLYFIGWAL